MRGILCSSASLPAIGLATLLTLAPAGAHADPAPSPAATAKPAAEEPAWEKQPAVRRTGFLLGVTFGPMVGQAAGYPNDAKKIGRQAYYTETGVGVGSGFTLWIGGALADWLTFGLGFTGGNLTAGDVASGAGVFTFRTELFPAFAFGGLWRELGVALETGGGVAMITNAKDTSIKLADSGGASRLGLTGFYDGIRFWRISMGPFAGGDYLWSETLRRGEFQIGWRTAMYAGKITPEPKKTSRSEVGLGR